VTEQKVFITLLPGRHFPVQHYAGNATAAAGSRVTEGQIFFFIQSQKSMARCISALTKLGGKYWTGVERLMEYQRVAGMSGLQHSIFDFE